VVAGLEEIDPVALARTVAQVEMSRMPPAQFGGALLPTGDDPGAAGNRRAVVEAEVALVLAHAAPVRRIQWRRHPQISFFGLPRVATLHKNVLDHTQIRYHKRSQREKCAWPITRDWFGKRPVPLSINSGRAKSRRSTCSTCWNNGSPRSTARSTRCRRCASTAQGTAPRR